MKRSGWVLYLYEDINKKEIFKIMEFKTIKDLSYVIKMEPSIISNWFHGLIILAVFLKIVFWFNRFLSSKFCNINKIHLKE